MTASRSFKLAAKATAEQKAETYEPITYTLVDADETAREVLANYPGDGAITLLIAASGTDSGDDDIASTIFGLLEETFNESDYKYIRAKVRSGELELEVLIELIRDMVETWTSFPTQRRSGSSQSPAKTGTRSTGRARSTASTPQLSLPDAS